MFAGSHGIPKRRNNQDNYSVQYVLTMFSELPKAPSHSQGGPPQPQQLMLMMRAVRGPSPILATCASRKLVLDSNMGLQTPPPPRFSSQIE